MDTLEKIIAEMRDAAAAYRDMLAAAAKENTSE